MTRKKTKDALELIRRDVGDDRGFRGLVEQEKANASIARMIFEARSRAGLTQKALAELAETTQPVIARLEDADYEGHSLAMLRRIAEGLGLSLVVGFEAPRESRGARRAGTILRMGAGRKKSGSRRLPTRLRARES